MNYDELIPGCSLHHFNLSGIDISLLNNKASKQVLPVHSTWTANPLEVSNLRFKCCASVRGENRYHIWTPRGCQTKQATVLSDEYEPRSPLWLPALPLMRRAGPSAPCRKGICETKTNFLTCKKMGKLHQSLTCFQVATERCRNSCKNVIHMSFTAVSCRLCLGCPRAIEVTCREWRHVLQTNNRQPVNWLETNRFDLI